MATVLTTNKEMLNHFKDHIQEWVKNWCQKEFMDDVKNMIIDDIAPKIDNWITNEYTPTIETWVKENFIKQPDGSIDDDIKYIKTRIEHVSDRVKPRYDRMLEILESAKEIQENDLMI